MEKEMMETVLQEILHELNGQQLEVSRLHKTVDSIYELLTSMNRVQSRPDEEEALFPGQRKDILRELLQEQLEALRTDIRKQPTVLQSHKHISILPGSFRMDQFPLLVDTIMKWVVALIVLFFLIWVALHYIQ